MSRTTICIPTHNRRDDLSAVFEALSAQTHQDFDILVCDDGSTDGVSEWLYSLNDPRLTVLRNEPGRGYARTMRRLFEQGQGEFLAVIHDHDGVGPSWLEQMIRLMESHPSAGLGCCACQLSSANGSIIEEGSSGLFALFGDASVISGQHLVRALATEIHTPLAVAGSIFRSEVVRRSGGYLDDWDLASDEDLYRRVAARSDVAFCRDRLLTLTARPAAAARTVGGWRSIYTLYEFRHDTALRYSPGGLMSRRWRAWRLEVLKIIALLRECISLWLRGESQEMANALRSDAIPRLPSGRPTLNRPSIALLTTLIWTLRHTPAVARWAGQFRYRNRSVPLREQR